MYGIHAIGMKKSWTPENEDVVRQAASEAWFMMTKTGQPSSYVCYLNFILGISVVSVRPLAIILILSDQFRTNKQQI